MARSYSSSISRLSPTSKLSRPCSALIPVSSVSATPWARSFSSFKLFPDLQVVRLAGIRSFECFVGGLDARERGLDPVEGCPVMPVETVGMEKFGEHKVRRLQLAVRCRQIYPERVVVCACSLDAFKIFIQSELGFGDGRFHGFQFNRCLGGGGFVRGGPLCLAYHFHAGAADRGEAWFSERGVPPDPAKEAREPQHVNRL